MRTIRRTAAFKRDYKREKKGKFAKTLDAEFGSVVAALASDRILPQRHRDHTLTGQWRDFRDCHIRPDLVPIYRKPDGGNSISSAWARTANSASDRAALAHLTSNPASISTATSNGIA